MSDPYQPPQPGEPTPPSGSHQPDPGAQPSPYDAPAAGYPQQPAQPQGGYPQGGYPPPYRPDPPGKVMGIVGFVLAFVFAPAGIVVSALALSDSKKVGYDNVLGKWGLWLSIVFTALGVLTFLVFFLAVLGSMSTSVDWSTNV